MFKFFVSNKQDDCFILDKETLNHIKVARIENENFICIFKEEFYKCYLQDNRAIIIEKINRDKDSWQQVIIAVSYIDNKRFEWMIQKATELGATHIIPVLSQNVAQKISNHFDKKFQRWKLIALHAAQQSFRSSIPQIEKLIKFENILKTFANVQHKYIAYAKSASKPLTSFSDNTIFLIGPEGGFTEQEIKLAKDNNFQEISLGPRILRSETASLFLLSRIN